MLSDNAGAITLAFTDENNGTLTWPSGNVQINRFIFDSGSNSDGGDSIPASGWWWNTDESGRGFAIERQGNTIFFAAFLYDDSGLPTWFTAVLNRDTAQDFSGILKQLQGGQTLLGEYQPPTVLNDNAGTITLFFSDANHGTLNWPGGSVDISRFRFAAGTGSGLSDDNSTGFSDDSSSGLSDHNSSDFSDDRSDDRDDRSGKNRN